MPQTTTARDRIGGVARGAAQRGTARSAASRISAAPRSTDWGAVARAVLRALHLPAPRYDEDRFILERVIFHHYCARADVRSVLFVGCRRETRHYGRSFFAQHDFWTLAPSETARKYGARQHVIAPLERLDAFFPERYFDLIVCDGVLGRGLDSPDACEAAFDHCFTRLRDGGHFVLGRDDVPERMPVPIANIESLKRFRRARFPPLGTARYLTDTAYRRMYEFYVRR